MWRHFLGDGDRVHHPDIDGYRASLVADLRRVHSLHPTDPGLSTLVSTLRERSTPFARLWDTAALGEHGNQRKTVLHPDLGPIELDCDIVTVAGTGLRLIIFTAEPGSTAADQLAALKTLTALTTRPVSGTDI